MVNVLAADVWVEGGGLIVGARPASVVKWLLKCLTNLANIKAGDCKLVGFVTDNFQCT